MVNLTNFAGKIKGRLSSLNRREDIFIILLILLVGFGGFGLGRLSKIEEGKTPVKIQDGVEVRFQQKVLKTDFNIPDSQGQYVASVKGSKYHFPWCSGAQRIKEENKIWFPTKKSAEQAGFTPAKNCKGL